MQMACRNQCLSSIRKDWAFPPGVPYGRAALQRVGLPPGSAGQPRCRLSLPPSARDQPAIRFSSPSGPPNARQLNSYQSNTFLAPIGIRSILVNASFFAFQLFNAFPFNSSTTQLLNFFYSTFQLFNCSAWVPPQQCMV
jgi:hypothetical protein